jgi:hypothetical protein
MCVGGCVGGPTRRVEVGRPGVAGVEITDGAARIVDVELQLAVERAFGGEGAARELGEMLATGRSRRRSAA